MANLQIRQLELPQHEGQHPCLEWAAKRKSGSIREFDNHFLLSVLTGKTVLTLDIDAVRKFKWSAHNINSKKKGAGRLLIVL
jgi:hypothetical protein